MKKLLLFTALFSGAALFAKHDGWYVNKLTENYKTEHLTWDKTTQPLNVLFFVQPTGARDVIELAQRMNIKYVPFLPNTYYSYASESVYRAALSGTSPFEKNEELRAALSGKFDVIFIGNAPFTKAPPDAQLQMLQKVQNGAGMIINTTRLPYKKVFAKPIPLPAFLGEVAHTYKEKNLKAYQFGKGRILTIKNAIAAPAITQSYRFSDNRAKALQENEYVFYMRAMQWAAGKDLSTGKVEDKGSYLSAPDGVQYRLRDEFNNVLTTGTVKNGKIPTNLINCNGTYFCDLIVKGKACSVFAFERKSAYGKADIAVSSQYLRGKAPFNGTVTLEKAAAKPLTLKLVLRESPNDKIWEIKEIKVPAGKKSVDFAFKNYRMPSEAGYLYATFMDGVKPVAKADKVLYFPSDKLPTYYQATFGNPTSLNMAKQLVDNMGFGVALSHLTRESSRTLARLNVQLLPYLVRVTVGKSSRGGVKLMYLTGKESKAAAKMQDQSFYNPAAKELWRAQVETRMDGLAELSPILYSLGDENVLDRSSGFGPSDLPAFRKFVEKKYGTIAKLNENWGTSYKSFAEVPHRKLSVSLKEKRFAEWNDHNEYMEKMFADIHHYTAKLIKAKDPHARVGLEGTFGGHDIELMMDGLDWWGPYSNMLEDQLLRSLYPDVPRFVWSGYHRERTMKTPLMNRYLLLGSVNGNGWYSTACDFNHDILAVDQSPSYPKSFNDSLQELRFGKAQVMIENSMFDSKIGIFWNHVSRRSPKVDERCVSPESGIGPVIRFCNATGTGFEFVTARNAAKRLPNTKVLFLLGMNALSDKEAAFILDFVKKGGTVIADFVPGRLNENLAIRKNNPLAALFGNQTLKGNGKYEVKPLSIPGFKASKALVDPAGKFMTVKKYGKGKAILLNFNFAIVETSADKTTPFNGFLKDLLVKNGALIPFSQSNQEIVFRVRSGKDFTLFGVYDNKDKSETVIKLPKAQFIYESGKGFVGKTAAIKAVFSEVNPLRLYAAFDKKQEAPVVTAPASVKAGGNVVLTYKNLPAGRTVVIRVVAPDGKEIYEAGVVTNTNNGKSCTIGIPYNASTSGKPYQFTVTDYVTGLSAVKNVYVK